MKILVVILLLTALCGCSGTQIRELFLPMSVQDLTASRVKYSKTFDMEPSRCFERTLAALEKMQAQVIHESPEKYFIVANRFDKSYVLCIDTTQTGILITPEEENRIRVDVASGNYDLAKFVSGELFESLEKKE